MQYYTVFAGHSSGVPIYASGKAANAGAKAVGNNSRRSMQRVKTTVGSNKARLITN